MLSARIYDEIGNDVTNIINKFYDIKERIFWKKTPNSSLGDISFPLFSTAKKLGIDVNELGEKIKEKLIENKLIDKIEVRGGFLNIFIKRSVFTRKILGEILKEDQYGRSDYYKNERIIIEHTSSNPTSPLHIGNFRGSVIGDVLARLFRFLGARVNVRYYVNDLGKQIAPLVVGYFLLKDSGIQPNCKIDHWVGEIYAAMNTFLEIQQLKEDLLKYQILEEQGNFYELTIDEYSFLTENSNKLKALGAVGGRLIKNINKYYKVQNSLRAKIPELYDQLLKLLEKHNIDLRQQASNIVIHYQKGDDSKLKSKVREVTNLVLSGHVETLKTFSIFHDNFDWESEIAWSGEVEKVLKELEKGGWLRKDGKARLLMNNKIGEELSFKKKHGIKYEIPDTILVNSEGTALYPCRDIAYHLHKLEKFDANRCYNIIGKQQQLPQLAVRLALYALGKPEIADKITHIDYEYVTLVGRKMSGRELEYVTPDELFDLTKKEIKSILQDRGYSKEEKEKISIKVAASSIRYSIVKIDPQKKVVFDVKKAIDPNENTGPFLQYSYARAVNILKKGEERGIKINYDYSIIKKIQLNIEKEEEWSLIQSLEDLPTTLVNAAEQKRPDLVANFAFNLASLFHKFYDTCPVLTAENEDTKSLRLLLVIAFVKTLQTIFEVLGIEKLEKM